MKVLSVIIPAYNVEKYLNEILPTFLIDDILDDIELLIVNDGSKDKTAVISQEYVDKYPHSVRLINKENGGHGSTINVGIKEAVGKYIKVVDGDDWVDSDNFVKFIEKLKLTDSDAILCPFTRVNESSGDKEVNEISGLEERKVYFVGDIISKIEFNYNMHNLTFKTEVLKDIPQIDENCFYVDQEFIIYPLKFVDTLEYMDCNIYQYRVGNNEQSVSKKNMQKNRNMQKKVIDSILGFYKANSFDEGVDYFIKNRLAGLSKRLVYTYLSMERDSDTKKEMMDFLKFVKQSDFDIYKRIRGRRVDLIKASKGLLYPVLLKR